MDIQLLNGLDLAGEEGLLARCALQAGYPGLDAVKQPALSSLERVVQRGLEVLSPAFTVRRTEVVEVGEKGFRAQGLEVESRLWARLARGLAGPVSLACFGVTVGPGFDELAREFSGNGVLDAYLLDAFGSVAAETLAAQAQGNLEEYFKPQGLSITRRFSPGYCDWPHLPGQKSIFSFLDPREAGIAISDLGIMTPRKSVTAVVLAAPEVPLTTPCPRCKNLDCDHRRV